MNKNYGYDEYYGYREYKTVCKLFNGNIVKYDACADKLDAYNPEVFHYIGKGIIHSIDGVVQGYDMNNPDHIKCFFVKYKKR